MTASDAIKSLEEYYGEYPRPAIKRFVHKYLCGFDPEHLSVLYKRVIVEVSCNRGTVPDVATIIKVKRMIEEESKVSIGPPVVETIKKKKPCCPKCGEELLGGMCMKCSKEHAEDAA